MTYRTCVGCVHGSGFCQERENIKAKVKGLAITSIKWKCRFKRPTFLPGEAVWVNVFVGMEDHGDSWGREEATFAEFPGIIIEVKGSKAIAFIEPGVLDSGEEYNFEPMSHGSGHVKITLARMRRREAIRENVCGFCKRVTRLAGHDDYCRNAPADQPKTEEYMF